MEAAIRSTTPLRASVVIAALTVAASVAACNSHPPSEQLTPTYAAVVEAMTPPDSTGRFVFRMAEGSAVEIRFSERRALNNVQAMEHGDLLLLGEGPGKAWAARVPGPDWHVDGPGQDDGKYIKTTLTDSLGLRLPKSAHFHAAVAPATDGAYAPAQFFLNEKGEIICYGTAGIC